MRSAVWLALLGFAAIALAGVPEQTPASAQTAIVYRWCMQPSAPRGPDCLYATIEQCRASASAVGFCYENPAFTASAQGRQDRSRR